MSRSTLATSLAAFAVSGLAMITASASTIGFDNSQQKCLDVTWAQTGCPFAQNFWASDDFLDMMQDLFGNCGHSDGESSKCDGGNNNGNHGNGNGFCFGDTHGRDDHGFGHDGDHGDHHYWRWNPFGGDHDGNWRDCHDYFEHDGDCGDGKEDGAQPADPGSQTPGAAVPEPASLTLLGLGALGLLVRRFKNSIA